MVWAALGNYGLDVATWKGSPKVWSAPLHTDGLYLDILVVWLVVVLVLALVGRLWMTLGITGLMVVLLGVTNATKLELRNDPVYPGDTAFLDQPGFLVDMVGGSKLVMAVIGIVVVLVGAFLAGKLVGKVLPNVGKGLTRRGKWILRGVRLVVVLILLGLLVPAGGFNKPGNTWRAAYDNVIERWRPWDQRVNYEKNGFVAGLLYNMSVEAMPEPAGYSEARMAQIAERYRQQAAALNAKRTGSLANANVVTVLSESFSDPTWLETVHWAASPIPKTEALMRQTLSGRLLTPGYGSGTANVEFELLTGQSMSQFNPQLQLAYDRLVSKYSTYPSMVDWFKAHGHEAIALHPFSLRMYKRPQVFKAFGFDKTLDKDSMTDPFRQDGSRFISDASAFDEVDRQIESNTKPILMHVISMQNHMPYQKQYDDPITPESGLPKGSMTLAGQYGRGINLTDNALAAWFDKLRTLKERTIVVFYGDHVPPEVYPANLVRREGVRATHETPWLIWDSKKPFAPRPLPTVSPTQLLPLMFDAADAPIPPYYALLDDLRRELPAMDAGIAIDGKDDEVALNHLTPAQRQVLDDYRMVQYDLSIGKRYSEKVLFGDS